ncbi:hypothetical protein KKD03_04520 [Patescibacteria group bacterium]|nr:hypothetical protein [Patescibacteria group bacterium]
MSEKSFWKLGTEIKNKLDIFGTFQALSKKIKNALAPFPKNNEQKRLVQNQQNERLMQSVNNWNELYLVLDKIGLIETSSRALLSELETKRQINKVRNAIDSASVLNYITRTHGLRDKVAELLIREEQEYQVKIATEKRNLQFLVSNTQNWDQLYRAIDQVAAQNNNHIPLKHGETTPREFKQAIYTAYYSENPNVILERFSDEFGILHKAQVLLDQRITEQKRYNLGNEFAENDIEKDNENIITNAQTWIELYAAIDQITANSGYIKSSSGSKYSASYLKSRITEMYHSGDPFEALSLVTRSYGIRKKAAKLLQQSHQAEQQFTQQSFDANADNFIKYVDDILENLSEKQKALINLLTIYLF